MKRMKRILSCTLALLLALLPLVPQPAFAYGEYQEAVAGDIFYTCAIDPSKVPAGTLLVGTHLIYMPMIYDKLYEMAVASASESGQTSVYYKSELAGGTWFEIGTASSVADITTTGAAVADSVIAKLKSTHHTKADGITYLTLGGARKVVWHSIINPELVYYPPKDFPINVYTHMKREYAVDEFPELISLKNTYQSFKDIAPTVMEVAWANLNKGWMRAKLGNDKVLDDLENIRRELIKQGAPKQELDVLTQLMDNFDNNRRIAYFKECDILLEGLTTFSVETTKEGEEPPEIVLMGMADTQKALRASIAKLQGRLITNGTTIQENERNVIYKTMENYCTSRAKVEGGGSNGMIIYEEGFPSMIIKGEDFQGMIKTYVAELAILENIMASDIVNREAELKMLKDKLLNMATYAYTSAMRLATNADYDEAAKIPAAVALRERAVSENNGKINVRQTELEQLILETVDRSSKEDGIAFINTRIAEANRYYRSISNTAFRAGGVVSVDAHIEFLKRLLKSLTGEESPTEELQKEKQKLQDSLMEALDENKTDEAEKIRDKIADVDNEITALEENYAYEVALLEDEIKKIEGEINEAPEEEAEKLADELADAKEKLIDIKTDSTDDSLIKVVEDLKKDGGDAIDRNDPGAVDVVVDSLISVVEQDPRVVVPAIKDIHDKMVDKGDGGGFKDQIAKAEDAIRDNANAVTEATKPKAERDIELIVGEYDPAEDKRNAAVVAALGQYVYAEGGNGMEDLWKDWLDKLLADNNPYVFIRYNDGDNEYIPYDVLGYFAGMRPVWYKTQQIGTLSKGGDYYSFKVDTTKVGRDKDSTKSDEMKITAKWQTVVHVHESYTKLKFDCEAFYIPNSIYGVLVSPEIKVMLDEILGKIEDASKQK